ncbi:hypothetical protein [Pararhodobacter zhoushanensis]|uniref:DUF4123 domain-containing protein n=1 Tax=Pararhodobacter zhoushanensis TaxID=2479545 RepID=A0ABT3H1A9_9RHOB|nr:hypothetical protein [Pararhodobacter zhoushanensis]MCW1933564.1 hypothetical protein [Pararhodobacter zhoushanensis]
MTQSVSQDLVLLEGAGQFPQVTLQPVTGAGYLVLALEIDHRPPFLFGLASAAKRQATERLRAFAARQPDAHVFIALVIPPGRGAYLRRRPQIRPARFDLVLLVETATPEAAQTLQASDDCQALLAATAPLARRQAAFSATNIRHIGPVDHARQGVFLFNWFTAEDLDQNLAVWNYTAGWFTDQTGLDNSTVLQPQAGQAPDWPLVNHCRWEGLSDILPALIFKRSFRAYVLAHFAANRTAAMPVLYRLAR